MSICCLSFSESNADGTDRFDFSERFSTAAKHNTLSVWGVFNSLPLIIFSYMYQPNIPAIYHELKKKNMMSMKKVLGIGTGMATIAYILCGSFGYITFVKRSNVEDIMEEQNILKAPYGDNTIIKCCLIGVLIVVTFAAPFCVLPSKDSFEELLMKDQEKFSSKQNFMCTFGIITLAYVIALVVPSIADAMTILGATTNSGIGFLMPIVFYRKVQSNKEGGSDKFSNSAMFSYFIFGTICICSCIEMFSFVYKKIHPD